MKHLRFSGELAYVPLTRGYETVIDAIDAHLVEGVGWQAWVNPNGRIYAARKAVVGGKRKTIRLHHLIVPLIEGHEVDHVDGDSLNNRRNNLRLGTRSENMRNLPIHRSGKVPGVSIDKRRGIYTATITVGTFRSLEEAVDAQRKAQSRLAEV